MSMLKIILYIAIILGCALMGFLYGAIYGKRHHNLSNLIHCIRGLETEVIISGTPLPDALGKIGKTGKGEIASIFQIIKDDLILNKREEVYFSFLAVESILREKYFLKNEDIDVLLTFSKVLGKTNREDQKKNFAIILNELEQLAVDANHEKQKNEKLYRSLGLLIGLTIAIILI